MKNIIIVDDSPIFQKIMESILSPYFTIVGKGLSGVDAIELYKKFEPDLLLLDITMPNCDGKESLQKIISLYPRANIVMVSGIADESTATECLSLGAKAFVSKNQISVAKLGNSEFLKTIHAVLGQSPEKMEAA